jgi:hypothetical protein
VLVTSHQMRKLPYLRINYELEDFNFQSPKNVC